MHADYWSASAITLIRYHRGLLTKPFPRLPVAATSVTINEDEMGAKRDR